ncbi:energy transducer TonB family protein [Piscirickettsia salmonis]|uniref:energy transducer TonB family protein n=1 Tax=Piscirickettsia salmonis TaxID=1238 RepID=UPI003A80BA5C
MSDHNDNNHAKLIQSRHDVKHISKDITKNAKVPRAERELKKYQKPQAQYQKKIMEKGVKISSDSKVQAKNKEIKLIEKVETKQKIESQLEIKPKPAQNQAKRFNKQPEKHPLGKTHAHKGAQREGLGGKSLLSPSYLQKLLIHLQKYKYYPPFALRRQIMGEAKVNIRLTCQGKVESYQLVKKTGSRLLDNAVRQMMKQASPFPAPKVCQGAFNVVVPIEFKILAS